MWKCENFLSSLAPLARTYYIHFLNVSALSVYCDSRLYYTASYYKWYKESALIVYLIMYADVIWDLK